MHITNRRKTLAMNENLINKKLEKVKPIPIRNWKNMNRDSLSVYRDKLRKKTKGHLHHLWFHYVRLALELEEQGYVFESKIGRKVLEGSEIRVEVDREYYKEWDIDSIFDKNFCYHLFKAVIIYVTFFI